MERKKSCMSINARNMDRISSLPDCILHQILSFLDTRFAVQTAILSKRWQNVFDTTPFLNFSYNFSEIADPLDLSANPYNELYDRKRDGFSECISKVLDAQNGYDCKKIVIRCDLMLDSKFVNSVMSYAVRHKAQEIEIMAGCDDLDRIEFPESIYTSQSLEKLKLVGDEYNYMYVSRSMGFRFLKELRLHRVELSREGFSQEIFPDCPNLELLSLVACSLESTYYPFVLSAPKLKTLEMIFLLSEKSSLRPSTVEISAPMLSYIKYEGPDPMHLILGDCASSLEEIDIDIQDGFSNGNIREKWVIERLIQMLREFRNAKSVIISLNTLEVLSAIPSLLQGKESPFANLKNIQLKTSWPELVPGWSFLLKNSPNVKASIQGDLNKVLMSETQESFRGGNNS
ncbi:F-box/LRR-repeat protein 25-like [Silene latifolia]|uniref:F-box/LRR-repeat protein 25-like n=1 Tax=Silene latifolia TaxID=37657 RepID=UPI003D77C3FB